LVFLLNEPDAFILKGRTLQMQWAFKKKLERLDCEAKSRDYKENSSSQIRFANLVDCKVCPEGKPYSLFLSVA